MASNAAFSALKTGIDSACANWYNKGHGQGVIDADARENTSSYNWGCGWNAGVAAADARPAPGTVNYQSGYDAGNKAGFTQGYNMGHDQGVMNAKTQIELALKNPASLVPNVLGYGFTVTYRKSDKDGHYPQILSGTTPNDTVYPYVSDHATNPRAWWSVVKEKEFSVGGGYRCWVVLVVWTGSSLEKNHWETLGTWTC